MMVFMIGWWLVPPLASVVVGLCASLRRSNTCMAGGLASICGKTGSWRRTRPIWRTAIRITAGQSRGQIGYQQTILLGRRLDYSGSMVAQSDTNNPTTQSAITAAVIQPTIFNQSDKVKRPITRGLLAKFIITTMIGATITPLMTALQ